VYKEINEVLEFTNIQGQLIKTITTNGKTKINISTFLFGVYIVEIKAEKGKE
jgi:hypothetical protein